jgi:ATP-binding cassette, subfamily B, bacterial
VAFEARDLDLVGIVVVALAALTVGTTLIDVVRSRLLAHLASRVGLAVIADFVARLLALPVAFFESRRLGDLLEKVSDHRRVDDLLAGSSLSVVFGALQIVLFGALLSVQSAGVALTFLLGTLLGVAWVLAWAPARRRIDQRRFTAQARSQALLIEMVTGVVDLKLAGAETSQRQHWERRQVKLFGVTMDALAVDQAQRVGAQCLNDLKNLAITWVAVRAVMDGSMSLGALVATQYVVGQLNAPIRELLGFVQRIQDASLALERADDAHREPLEQLAAPELVCDVPRDADLELVDVGFTYPGPDAAPVLDGISLRFAAGRTTAIVGSSGSGKTTLLKLMLGLHRPTSGRITIGGVDARNVSLDAWRACCGVVMQDGRIFDATVLANVALGDPEPDPRRALDALARAQLAEWLGQRALGLSTRLGAGGEGLSQGQRQRLLIARALYRDPAYLFLDEATSALDANNERAILGVLDEALLGKTSVVIAHRLSTVRRADRIVVIEHGRVVESGTHAELVAREGAYLRLVRNQLELGAAA